MRPAPPPPRLLRRRQLVSLGLHGLGLTGLTGLAPNAFANTGRDTIPVVYPDLGEPYRSVFTQMLQGIENRLGPLSEPMALPSQGEPAVVAELMRRRPRVILALGRAALKAALSLDYGPDIVAGAVVNLQDGDQRASALLSMSPDPALLLQRLRQLLPQTQRVTVVYSASQSAWLVRLAEAAARGLGLELRALLANDLRAALPQYQGFFGQAATGDALWLLQDPNTVDEATVVPLVLQESWNRSVPVLSSNLAHVRRGALLALYANNLQMGRSLGQTALAVLNRNNPPRGTQPLRDVLAAVNTRTATHLGLSMSGPLANSFDQLFPES